MIERVPRLTRLLLGAEPLLGPQTGIGTYSRALHRGIARERPDLRLDWVANGRLLAPDSSASEAGVTGGRGAVIDPLRRLLHRLPGYVALRQFTLQYSLTSSYRCWHEMSRRPPPGTLYHEPNFVLRPFNGPSVTTIHDLTWLHYPETMRLETRRLMERGMPRTLERADLLLTVSRFVRDELIDHLGVAAARVRVTPNGVDARFHPRNNAEIAMTLARYRLVGDGYLLAVATPEPRKNLVRLVQAFARLPSALQSRYPLVLVGGHGWGDTLQSEAEPLQRRGQLRRLGYVPDAELPALYAGARGFALPSLYEGFGLPILEAMASGAPVLTSNGSAMAEVADGAAILIDPLDVDSIAQGLRRLLADAELRAQLIQAGSAHARGFSWQQTVSLTLAAYDGVMNGH